MIDDDGSPRLADFGSSRIAQSRGFTTAFLGSARYMAPELTIISDDIREPVATTSDGGELDAFPEAKSQITTKQSDVYAFSMVVLEVGVS